MSLILQMMGNRNNPHHKSTTLESNRSNTSRRLQKTKIVKSSRSRRSNQRSARSNSSGVRRAEKSLSKGRYNEDLVAQRIYSHNKKLNSVRPIEIEKKK